MKQKVLERPLALGHGVQHQRHGSLLFTLGLRVRRDSTTCRRSVIFTMVADHAHDGIVSTADDRGLFTFYDYDPAYRGSQFVATTYINAADRDSFWHNITIEVPAQLLRTRSR